MTRFTTVDPGGKCLGWAVWEDGWLLDVGLSRTKATTWQSRARYHRAFFEGMGVYSGLVLTECMRVRGGRNAGNPQILVELNGIAGHVGNVWIEPGTWKGRLSKEIHQPRILLTLSPEERLLVESIKPASLVHNAVDAVGIGLYHLGRLTPTTQRITKPRARSTK